MTREEIARVTAQSKSAALSEAIDAFQELARETEAFSDLQVVTVYLKHVRAVADIQLSKLHQDAGNAAEPFFRLAREVINPVNGERPWHADSKDWMVVFSFAGQSITLGDLRRAAAADALERGSQAGDGWVPTHRHLKRGTEYRLIGPAILQTEKLVGDYTGMVVYEGAEGDLWVRPAAEFNDGRFEPLAAAPAHGGGG